MQYITHSPDETRALGRTLAQALEGGAVVDAGSRHGGGIYRGPGGGEDRLCLWNGRGIGN